MVKASVGQSVTRKVLHFARRSRRAAGWVLFAGMGLPSLQAGAQQSWLAPVPEFPLATPSAVGGLVIQQKTSDSQPFTVAGPCGAFVGMGDGSFEAWDWPVKLISHMHIEAQVQDYTVPIDVNQQSAQITVQPDHTTITFAHAAFTVREILFANRCDREGEGGVEALFQVVSSKPVTLTFSFDPEVKQMWPAPNYNTPVPEWIPLKEGGGYYLLHTDSPSLTGAVAMPGTEPGILAPYQERPHFYPLQLVLHYDPTRDAHRYFPLLMAAGADAKTADWHNLTAQLTKMATNVQSDYDATADYWKKFFAARVTAETPDPRVNQALSWAEVSIDQLQVRHGAETGLVAGLYSSGDSNRPGFGWFFGRDSLFSLYAVDSYGDFGLTREELDFLLARQRADGKIMHEYSQTADLVDWAHLPYEYAAADSTPLMLMLMADYVQRSGDTAYLQQHWAQMALAWKFERTHDSDGDGIYDNAQGTGWVESWPPGMPHQEIYLASLDEQASLAYAQLAKLAGKGDGGATERAAAVAATIVKEYKPAAPGMYAFSYNGTKDGKAQLDTTATIYPSIAWWQGTYALPDADGMFKRWASDEFSTDWGVRDLGNHETLYDPMSYHQGSVWPLFAGWASMAEYRTGRPLAGYQHLMENLDQTWAQDLGAVTELLSGDYFEPMGRSTTHQLWSSAMVLSPLLRGLFGVDYNAATNTLTVRPQLPADWDGATLRHVPVSDGHHVAIVYRRDGGMMTVEVQPEDGGMAPKLAGPDGATVQGAMLRVPLPGVELGVPAELPLPGSTTAQMKVLAQGTTAHGATWTLSAPGGTVISLPLRWNGVRAVQVDGATEGAAQGSVEQGPLLRYRPLDGDRLVPGAGPAPASAASLHMVTVHFPTGEGYVTTTVTASWAAGSHR